MQPVKNQVVKILVSVLINEGKAGYCLGVAG